MEPNGITITVCVWWLVRKWMRVLCRKFLLEVKEPELRHLGILCEAQLFQLVGHQAGPGPAKRWNGGLVIKCIEVFANQVVRETYSGL